MLRRLLILAFVVFAVLGLRSGAFEQAIVAEAQAAVEGDDCCPCDDDGSDDDGCCSSRCCACFATVAVALPPRVGAFDPRAAPVAIEAWSVGAEQRARDRASAPPTPPPNG